MTDAADDWWRDFIQPLVGGAMFAAKAEESRIEVDHILARTGLAPRSPSRAHQPAFLTQTWRIGAPNQRKSLCCSDFLRFKESAPMPTECSAESFDFGTVERRAVEAAFDAGLVTSDAGALARASPA